MASGEWRGKARNCLVTVKKWHDSVAIGDRCYMLAECNIAFLLVEDQADSRILSSLQRLR
jgi:hypothetical protein